MASRGINVVVQVGSTICLARLLMPEDVGLVGMVTVYTGLAPVLMDLGTRDAAVQKAKITEDEVSALFWLTMGIGTFLAVLLVACSPLIVKYNEGESQLQSIAIVSAIAFILSAASCQHMALDRKSVV